MILKDQIQKLIGKPYTLDYNCWHLVMDLVPEVPFFDVTKDIKKNANELFKLNEEYKDWEMVNIPSNGDVILLGKNEFTHAGVYYEGLIVHNVLGVGVIAVPLKKVKPQYRMMRIYHLKD